MQKHEIKNLVLAEVQRLNTKQAVANKLGVSAATVSNVVNGKWTEITDRMWRKIASVLDYNPKGWQLVETTNIKMLNQIFLDAKSQNLFLAVSQKAGNGKTTGGRAYAAQHHTNAVFFLQCREWNRSQFLTEVCKMLGLAKEKNTTSEMMIASVTEYLDQRNNDNPLIILDEADKLHPDAMRALIPLYNELEDKVGMVIMGTDNLERDMLNGIKYKKKGYDEIYSRFGRQFINLYGATKTDCKAICKANGVSDAPTISKLFVECQPEQMQVGNQFVKMVTDLRKLKRAIQREKLMAKAS